VVGASPRDFSRARWGRGPARTMFLIFSLARRDVWPTTDAGLRAAALRLYDAHSKTSLEQFGRRFQPQRSVAALYLWRSLENTVAGDG